MNERKALPPDPVPDEKKESGLNYIFRHLGPNRAQRRANERKRSKEAGRGHAHQQAKKNARDSKHRGEKIAKKSRQDQIRHRRTMDKAARSRKARAARK